MRLPDELRDAIDEETSGTSTAEMLRASAQLTSKYKEAKFIQSPLNTTAARHAYLQVRLPATFAANDRVFAEIRAALPNVELRSMLDLGAGPGTAMWAAAQVFPAIERFTMLERDGELIDIGRRLAFAAKSDAIRSAVWVRQDLSSDLTSETNDLVVVSYALGELAERTASALLRRAWLLAGKVLAVIEPGTPEKFKNVLAAREMLHEAGAHVVAPCPHSHACPLAAVGDWCHFSQRLERSSAHRKMKGGALGYEDEKFSYVAFAKAPVHPPEARIVRHPRIHSGHVQLTLCTPEGLRINTIGKSRKVEYRQARQARWGDPWTLLR